MKTRIAPLMIGLLLGAASACATASPTLDPTADRAALRGAEVEIDAQGGIAALATMQRVDHDTRSFTATQRRICGNSCGAPLDSASGTISEHAADSLFTLVLQSSQTLTSDDYGATRNGADMMAYTIRISFAGQTRTIRGDDGSVPDAAHQIINVVRQTISTARGR